MDWLNFIIKWVQLLNTYRGCQRTCTKLQIFLCLWNNLAGYILSWGDFRSIRSLILGTAYIIWLQSLELDTSKNHWSCISTSPTTHTHICMNGMHTLMPISTYVCIYAYPMHVIILVYSFTSSFSEYFFVLEVQCVIFCFGS